MMTIRPGLRRGTVTLPPSKSYLHRFLIANFLAGDFSGLKENSFDVDDVRSTKRCLRALADDEKSLPVLDCGECASTLRFLSPIAAALGKTAVFEKKGRLKNRPNMEYCELRGGVHEVYGHISSQFVSGLLFALPLLGEDSEIRFLSPLQSRGYVDMTLFVLRKSGIEIEETAEGFCIPSNQHYKRTSMNDVEPDWSCASFWLAANELGNDFKLPEMNCDSLQPDAKLREVFGRGRIDVREFPDGFPALVVSAAAHPGKTVFTGIERLRIKESDRVAAMSDVLCRFGVTAKDFGDSFEVTGTGEPFRSGLFKTFGDHRIAMATAVGATRADGDVFLDDEKCITKSYPSFFENFNQCSSQSVFRNNELGMSPGD